MLILVGGTLKRPGGSVTDGIVGVLRGRKTKVDVSRHSVQSLIRILVGGLHHESLVSEAGANGSQRIGRTVHRVVGGGRRPNGEEHEDEIDDGSSQHMFGDD